MMRIIVAILEALFGIESEPEAPPTRRPVRRPARPGPAGSPSREGGEKPATLEDFVKRFLGIEDEPPPKPTRAQQPQPQQPERQPARPQQTQPAMPRPRQQSSRPAPRPLPAVPAEETAAGRGAGNPARAYAQRLRANPAAAREAFVYAEIFGPPVADRRPGEGGL